MLYSKVSEVVEAEKAVAEEFCHDIVETVLICTWTIGRNMNRRGESFQGNNGVPQKEAESRSSLCHSVRLSLVATVL